MNRLCKIANVSSSLFLFSICLYVANADAELNKQETENIETAKNWIKSYNAIPLSSQFIDRDGKRLNDCRKVMLLPG